MTKINLNSLIANLAIIFMTEHHIYRNGFYLNNDPKYLSKFFDGFATDVVGIYGIQIGQMI